eukprot:2317827-Lingulodinium_polyedra.AAC.1
MMCAVAQFPSRASSTVWPMRYARLAGASWYILWGWGGGLSVPGTFPVGADQGVRHPQAPPVVP